MVIFAPSILLHEGLTVYPIHRAVVLSARSFVRLSHDGLSEIRKSSSSRASFLERLSVAQLHIPHFS